MKKLFSALCMVTIISACSSGCTNTSNNNYGQQTPRRVGTVVNDASITADVKAKFITDDNIKAFRINVDTYKGVVTLTGTVPTREAHERAVALAKETNGVRNVISKLEIR